jgi:putative transposase
MMDSLSTLKHPVGNDSMMSIASPVINQSLLPSAIAEYPVQDKKTTSKAKLNLCANAIRKEKLSKTSAAGLTSKEKGFVPYWNERYQENVSDLWLPTETVLQGLDTNLSNGLLKNPAANSWFTTRLFEPQNKNLLKTSSKFYTYSLAECTDNDDIELIRTKRIRLYPTAEQKSLLRNWFGVSRLTFNWTVEQLKEPGTKASQFELSARLD